MKLTAIILILQLSLSVFASEIQKTPKLGKVSMDELESTQCPIDSSEEFQELIEQIRQLDNAKVVLKRKA